MKERLNRDRIVPDFDLKSYLKSIYENFKISDRKYQFWILKIAVFLAGIGYLVKLLSNHYATLSPKNLENISNFKGWSLIVVACKEVQSKNNKLEN